jgi:hypothetical protein
MKAHGILDFNYILTNSEAVLVGAKDFRPPAKLGDVRARYCYVIVMSRPTNIRAFFDEDPDRSEKGIQFWKWKGRPTEGHPDPRLFFASQIGESFFVLTNNVEDVEDLALDLKAPRDDFQTLGEMRDWDIINSYEFWGYRRVRRGPEVNATAAGLIYISPAVQRLTFFVDSRTFRRKAVFRIFGSTDKVDSPVIPDLERILPKFGASDNGTWQTTIPMTRDQVWKDRTTIVMFMFGFGFYI